MICVPADSPQTSQTFANTIRKFFVRPVPYGPTQRLGTEHRVNRCGEATAESG